MEIEIDIRNWWCVFGGSVVIAVFANDLLAKEYADFKQSQYKGVAPDFYQMRQITAKVDFTLEQIQNELSKRCAEIEKSHCKNGAIFQIQNLELGGKL